VKFDASLLHQARASSFGRFLFVTGWPAVFCFGYAAVSAGFTIVWALAALNIFDEEAPDNRAHFAD